MAIQTIKTGAAVNDGTGDDARTCFTKINQNFTDNANAASRLVGTNGGNVMDVGAFGLGGSGQLMQEPTDNASLQTAINNKTKFFRTEKDTQMTYKYSPSLSINTGDTNAVICCGYAGQGVKISTWVAWQAETVNTYELYHKKSAEIYNTTTASSPNVFVTSTGELQRSTSSERYKKDIEHVSLNDQQYQAIRQVKPIAYKSAAEVDNPNWTFQSFSAEELAKASPTLVLWEYEETVIDEGTGLQVTRPLAQRRPAGLNLNGIVALQHAVSLKQADLIDAQAKQIKDLTKRITALEAK